MNNKSLHDWTLTKITLDWHQGQLLINLEDTNRMPKTIIAKGVRDLHIPRMNEWGPSNRINDVAEAGLQLSSNRSMQIEMQSGDVIRIEASELQLPVGI
jgi:hypothetical protein